MAYHAPDITRLLTSPDLTDNLPVTLTETKMPDPTKYLTELEALDHLTQLADQEGQSALARRLGVTPALMSHVLSGRQGIGKKLAKSLGWQLTLTKAYTPLTETEATNG